MGNNCDVMYGDCNNNLFGVTYAVHLYDVNVLSGDVKHGDFYTNVCGVTQTVSFYDVFTDSDVMHGDCYADLCAVTQSLPLWDVPVSTNKNRDLANLTDDNGAPDKRKFILLSSCDINLFKITV